jgi:hypothetical protein
MLIIPALMRIVGLPPLITWKLFILMTIITGTITTYCSLKYISRSWECSVAGTFLIMLSEFYLADLVGRTGMSEYFACIFVPVLVAGIYDYIELEAKKTYLIGVAFVGMVLTHTLMTVAGLVVTAIFFVGMCFNRSKRRAIFNHSRFPKLIITAIISVLSVSFYIFPMIEQILNDDFVFSNPWAHIGGGTQTFASFFNAVGGFMYTASTGIGIPLLILLGCRLMLGKTENRNADVFMLFGLLIFVLTTDIFPWKIMEKTFLNMLQFTYRFYPYAICFTVTGVVLYLKDKKAVFSSKFIIYIIIAQMAFGIWENVVTISESNKWAISYDIVMDSTNYVGQAEWLPIDVSWDVPTMQAKKTVSSPYGEIIFTNESYNTYSFEASDGTGTYTVPLVYYKGYKAELIQDDGNNVELQVSESDDALVEVYIPENMDGKVIVKYAGTIVQRISNGISLMVIAGVAIYVFLKKKNNQKNQMQKNQLTEKSIA